MTAMLNGMRRHAAKSAAFLFLASCGDRQPLRIAVVGSAGAPLGAVLAAEDINAAGGINGTLLELGVVNEPPNVLPRDAIATAESLATDERVIAVIGHGGSATSLAAATVYNARHVPQIAPDASSPLFTGTGPYSVRLVASDRHQAAFIVDRIQQFAPGSRVAVLYVNDDYGRAFNGFLRRLLPRAGLTLALETPFLAGDAFTRNLDALLQSVVHAKPDLLIWIGLPPELVALRPRLHQAIPHLRVFGSDGVNFLGRGTELRPFVGDWVVSFADLAKDDSAAQALGRRFQLLSGRELTGGAALTYDAVGLLAQAMRSGATDRESIKRYLSEFTRAGSVYEGVTGPIAFDSAGDARPRYVMLEVTPTGRRRITP
jgi:branched-chain amino acid transport system substrate-binding protein